MSEITLTINDVQYGGWKSASVDLSIESLSGTFNLVLTDRWAGQNNPVYIKPQDSCVLAIDGKIVITGYVDVVNLTVNSSQHSIQVMGRDRACDLIDCAVINGTGQYKNLKIEQIITRICSVFNIRVTCDIDTGLPIKTFNIEQGSTAIDAIQKLCYSRQCLAISDGLGGVLITRAGTTKGATQLIEGINVLSSSANYDYSQRFSHYIVKGQQQGSDTLDANSIAGNKAIVADSGITRYRPLVIVAEGQATKQDCSTRGTWELNTRKGRSRRISVVAQSWLQENGDIWRINQLVFMHSETLGVYDDLLIAGINFSMSENGELTTLSLTSKDAYLTLLTKSLDSDENPYILEESDES